MFNSSVSPDSSALTFQTTASDAQTYHTQDSLDFSSSPIPRTPSVVVPSLIRRPKTQPRTQRTANLILHNLKSYPLMIQHHNDLPPFIHKSLISSNFEDADMESLTNCLSLVHMLNGGGQAGRKLFWKNVQMECERLSAEHLNLSKWELLSAIQALTMLGVVYRVLNMLIYFDPAAMCYLPDDLVLAPLPARRQLWEAGDESAWRGKRHKGPPGAQVSFGLAAGGEVVRLDEGRLSCGDACVSPRRASDAAGPDPSPGWEEWCSGMDGFGGLVMLAASLLG
ncbi:hypothetical protein INS49_006145 [Diaporthe citri]|uniref:uncharacterized protein n=1 Tax=Diaporthe citri TaxID=83186 RepID=UPI001C7EEC37|nr:uncharacterized protein INS49_006145 [Diaporthe citri]KAG6364544.1 hypothetical protein INS49_006145 [Diaporthe citri]